MKKKRFILIIIIVLVVIITAMTIRHIKNSKPLSIEDATALYKDNGIRLNHNSEDGDSKTDLGLITDIIENLTSKDINAVEKNTESTSLILASTVGYVKLTEALINEGANIHFKNKKGNSALLTAVQRAPMVHSPLLEWSLKINSNDREDIIKMLLDDGADIEDRDSKFSENSLMYATRNNNIYVIDLLINRGADINSQNNYGLTPLMIASL